MNLEILILEDDVERRETMSACLGDRFRHYTVKCFETAPEMISYLKSQSNRAIAIALDHDLEYEPNENGAAEDPGTGREVADFLATRSPACPVVIHSTNAPAAVGMKMVLEDASWTTYRVVPFNDLEWISEVWIQTMRRAIVDTAAVVPEGTSP